MPEVVQLNQELQLVEVTLTGRLTLPEMNKIRKRVRAFSADHQIERILVNATGLMKLPATGSLYEFGASFWKVGFSKNARLGIVVSETTSSDFQFIETVAQNRAFMFRQFSTREAAVQWLLA